MYNYFCINYNIIHVNIFYFLKAEDAHDIVIEINVTLDEDIESLKMALKPSFASFQEEMASISRDVEDPSEESDGDNEKTIVELQNEKIKKTSKTTVDNVTKLIYGKISKKKT